MAGQRNQPGQGTAFFESYAIVFNSVKWWKSVSTAAPCTRVLGPVRLPEFICSFVSSVIADYVLASFQPHTRHIKLKDITCFGLSKQKSESINLQILKRKGAKLFSSWNSFHNSSVCYSSLYIEFAIVRQNIFSDPSNFSWKNWNAPLLQPSNAWKRLRHVSWKL